MKPRLVLDRALTPGGETITLAERGGHFTVDVAGDLLMASTAHHSEEVMAELARDSVGAGSGARWLVGGLGMGYTLRAVLDAVAQDAEVFVVEVIPAVVTWNRGPLAHLAGRPLDDPRVRIVQADLVRYLADRPPAFDAILVDVDNGPEPFTSSDNARLYRTAGISRMRAALRPGGVLVVWSAFESAGYLQALRRGRFDAHTVPCRARRGKGRRHTLFVARRPAD